METRSGISLCSLMPAAPRSFRPSRSISSDGSLRFSSRRRVHLESIPCGPSASRNGDYVSGANMGEQGGHKPRWRGLAEQSHQQCALSKRLFGPIRYHARFDHPGPTNTASTRFCCRLANAASISRGVAAVRTTSSRPATFAAACASLTTAVRDPPHRCLADGGGIHRQQRLNTFIGRLLWEFGAYSVRVSSVIISSPIPF
jgi:hypothetical protein